MRVHSQLLVDAGGNEATVEHCIKMVETAPKAEAEIIERFAVAMREPFGVRCFLFDISQKRISIFRRRASYGGIHAKAMP